MKTYADLDVPPPETDTAKAGYTIINGHYWLVVDGVPVRELTAEEVQDIMWGIWL